MRFLRTLFGVVVPAASNVPACMQVLERLADAVEAEVGPVLADSYADQAGSSTFNFLGASVLAEVDAALAAALPGAGCCMLKYPFQTNLSLRHHAGILPSACRG